MKLVCKVTKPYSLLFRILPFRQEKNQGRFNSIAIVNLFPQSAMELCKNFVMHNHELRGDRTNSIIHIRSESFDDSVLCACKSDQIKSSSRLMKQVLNDVNFEYVTILKYVKLVRV